MRSEKTGKLYEIGNLFAISRQRAIRYTAHTLNVLKTVNNISRIKEMSFRGNSGSSDFFKSRPDK